MPKLLHFESAAYPPEAEQAGLQADVVLRLDIDVEGKVTRAEAVEPQGHGFDEAAVAAALLFRFEPALRDGKPFAARILYKYSFTLKPAEPAPTEPGGAAAPPAVGNLGGVVRMSEGQAPVSGAEVLVTALGGVPGSARGGAGKGRGGAGPSRAAAASASGASGPIRVLTDAQGRWTLEGLSPGLYEVEVHGEGFVPMKAREQVAAGEATEVVYRIGLLPVGLEVVVEGERPPREVTRRTIERREMSRVPGTSGDALRSIQSLPGVARPPALAGLLIVRGSAPQDTNTFIDGALVPLIYHFGGLSSAVPTELLDHIDFYPGNFGARYGRVMGGIVDVSLRAPDTECTGAYGARVAHPKQGCFHGLAQVDLIDARGLLQGPIGGKWTFAVGGRRSWIDSWLGPVLESADAGVTRAPVYYDYQLIAEHRTSESSRLSLRFLGSDDRFDLVVNKPSAREPAFAGSLSFGTAFWTAQALHETRLSKGVELSSMLSAGRTALDFGLGQVRLQIDSFPVAARSELGIVLAKGVKLDAGMDLLVAPYHVFTRAPMPPRVGETNGGPFSTRRLYVNDESGAVFRPALYLEGELKPSARSLLVPSLRYDYAKDTGHSNLSPRINGRYDLIGGAADELGAEAGKRRRRTTVKGGVGLYYQPPTYQETDRVFGTPGLLSNRAIHYVVGVEQELTRQVEVGVEAYYKDLAKLVSRTQSLDGAFSYNNLGDGYVIGMETLLKYKPDKRFFGWLAYTLLRSVRRNFPGDQERLFQFDQTHIATLLGSYRLGRGWEFGARFRLVSGNLYTPVAQQPALTALYAADASSYTPLQGDPFSRRLPMFHQLDMRIDKGWQFEGWRLSTYLDVQNAYNHPAVEALRYNYDFTSNTYQTGLPIIPSIGTRGEF